MSTHSYSRCWLHLIWETLRREPMLDKVVQLLKGSSSHWINQNRLVKGRFAWGRGYGAFSVSHSDIGRVANYIARQEEHHRRRTFAEEYEIFVKRYGLEWRDEENR